ncbi:MAG TPA: hypothetical protein VHF22_11325 [Planctomycetota bacterium]|nr:hypothetical protein [Planctomycetota bacterium]
MIARRVLILLALAAGGLAPARAADAPAAATATSAPFAIDGFELAASRLGPARASREFLALERVVVRFVVRGFAAPKDDPAGFAIGIGVAVGPPRADAATAEVPRIGAQRGRDAFAAGAVPITLSFPLGGGVTAGTQEIVIEVVDEPTGRRARRVEAIEVRAPDRLAILGTYFSADAAGEIERPPVFTVGEDVRLNFGVAGLLARDGRIRGRTDLRVLDAEGKVVSEREGLMRLESEVKPGLAAIDGATAITATRPGTFRLEIVQHDLNARTTTRVERTIEVRSPPVQ